MIEIEQSSIVLALFAEHFSQYVSGIWEDLCREAVPGLAIAEKTFKPASRWWGSPEKDVEVELDVVAESLDGKYLLIGECKWTDKSLNPEHLKEELLRKASYLPFAKGKTVVPILFLKESPASESSPLVMGPKRVLQAMKSIKKPY